jgi:mitogen-activated protein kinase kinase
VKPAAIMEEDEEEDITPSNSDSPASNEPTPSTDASESINLSPLVPSNVVDREVAEWVLQAIEKRKQGKLGRSAKPALHAAPLDAIATPEAIPTPEAAPTTKIVEALDTTEPQA